MKIGSKSFILKSIFLVKITLIKNAKKELTKKISLTKKGKNLDFKI
jgi:hypothetical protein